MTCIHIYIDIFWCLLGFELTSALLLLPPPLCPTLSAADPPIFSPPPPALLAKSKGTAFSKSFLFRLYEKRRLLCECLRALICLLVCVSLL